MVIGRTCRNVAPARALEHVFGYTLFNDVSARDLQFSKGGQWTRSKSLDTFGPLGPELVTADEIPDPQALRLRTTVSGEVLQNAGTGDMIFGIAELIAFLSDGTTLEPGDVIATRHASRRRHGAQPPELPGRGRPGRRPGRRDRDAAHPVAAG